MENAFIMGGKSAAGLLIAIAIGVWATFALDVYSTLNSSPQTTEVFIEGREDSLFHWVNIGAAVAIGGGLIASVISWKIWPLLSTVAIAAMMHGFYNHAKKRGLQKSTMNLGAATG